MQIWIQRFKNYYNKVWSSWWL